MAVELGELLPGPSLGAKSATWGLFGIMKATENFALRFVTGNGSNCSVT